MPRILRKIALISMLCLNTSMAANLAAEEAVEIGKRWELFVDQYLIDDMKGEIELRLHSPTVQEVVLVHDKPWEGNTSVSLPQIRALWM